MIFLVYFPGQFGLMRKFFPAFNERVAFNPGYHFLNIFSLFPWIVWFNEEVFFGIQRREAFVSACTMYCSITTGIWNLDRKVNTVLVC